MVRSLRHAPPGPLACPAHPSSTRDARNRLTAISGPTINAAFAYDSLGRRVTKTINSQSTSYLYDGMDAVRESGAAGDATYLRSLVIDEALARSDSASTSYYLADVLGSTVDLTAPDGSLTAEYNFAPFGETSVSGLSPSNPFQFTGRENDGIGLYYYRARYYHPGPQRFTSEDPLGFLGGDPNTYAYASGGPMNSGDPLGLTAQSNWNFFWDWVLERGQAKRFYGPNTLETQEMISSPGAQAMRNTFKRGQCSNIQIANYDTLRAYVETVPDPTSTAFQVGGFVYSAVGMPGGQVRYRIYNQASMYLFFLHAPGMPRKPRGGRIPFMGNIDQTFEWVESSPCGCKSSR